MVHDGNKHGRAQQEEGELRQCFGQEIHVRAVHAVEMLPEEDRDLQAESLQHMVRTSYFVLFRKEFHY